MKRKIVILGLLAIFMLVSISFVSSADVNSEVETKASPLYKVRAKMAIGEKISNLLDNIKTKFLCRRVFLRFTPLQRLSDLDDVTQIGLFKSKPTVTFSTLFCWCP